MKIAFIFLIVFATLLSIDAAKSKKNLKASLYNVARGTISGESACKKKFSVSNEIVGGVVKNAKSTLRVSQYIDNYDGSLSVDQMKLKKCATTDLITQNIVKKAKKDGYNTTLCPATTTCHTNSARHPSLVSMPENLQVTCACGLGTCAYQYGFKRVFTYECDSTTGMMLKKEYDISIRVGTYCHLDRDPNHPVGPKSSGKGQNYLLCHGW
eukprot:m.124819 g.124819  ORF g.124819 m.124819 type:complete len:211 (+) comp37855_c0_seq1:593-1225(+)